MLGGVAGTLYLLVIDIRVGLKHGMEKQEHPLRCIVTLVEINQLKLVDM